MKRAWLIVGMIAAVFMFTSAAMASDPTINLASFDPRYLNGGPFIATVGGDYGDLDADRLVPGQFITFCLEKGELIELGFTYGFTINTSADGGGLGGGNPNPLSPMSAYLYSKYRANPSNYDGQALQAAFWHIEQELDTTQLLAWDYINEAASATALGGAWYNTWGLGTGLVVVLNLYRDWDNSGTYNADDITRDESYGLTSKGKRQSQIALLKPQGVPEPATMLLLGLGLVGLAAVGRKLKR